MSGIYFMIQLHIFDFLDDDLHSQVLSELQDTVFRWCHCNIEKYQARNGSSSLFVLSLKKRSSMKVWILVNTMDQHTFLSSFLRSIDLIHVAFFIVSSWVLSIDFAWFSRLPTIYIYIWWNITHGSCLPSTRNLEKIYYRIADITHNFQSYSVLRDTTLVQWLFLSIRRNMHLLLYTSP